MKKAPGPTQAAQSVLEEITKRQEIRSEIDLSSGLSVNAGANPWRLFTTKELAGMLMVSVDAIYVLKKNGAPFAFNRSRPEWLHDWMLANPTKCAIAHGR